jgi:hypothetical protein
MNDTQSARMLSRTSPASNPPGMIANRNAWWRIELTSSDLHEILMKTHLA